MEVDLEVLQDTSDNYNLILIPHYVQFVEAQTRGQNDYSKNAEYMLSGTNI